jgi:3-oxoacyl-[acyl-carrier-protein] synthase III
MTHPVYIAGTGSFLPGDPIPFSGIDAALGALPDAPKSVRRWYESSGAVMRELLDVKYVHYALDPVTREFFEDNVTMAVKAAQAALAHAGMAPDDIDLICYGSSHQDQMPTASVRIQEALGIECCDELAIHANCTSAYKALYCAHQFISSGKNRNALVISANISSSELCAEYYNQPLIDKESLFLRWFLCDGAGAAVVTSDQARSRGYELEFSFIESIGGKRPSLMYNERPALWMPPNKEFGQARHHLRQKFRNALSTPVFREKDGSVFFSGLRRMLAKGNIPIDKIKLLQVNMPTKHIIESIMDECITIGIPETALYSRLNDLGYCGPPMVFICLDKIIREEKLAKEDRIVSFVTEVSKFMQAGYSIVKR